MTLVEFLRARLAEREQNADCIHDLGCGGIRYDGTCDCGEPERVLHEVEAKRRIVATFVALDTHPNRLTYAHMQQQWVALRAVIAALTLPYADHPDYQQEWALTPA